MPDERIVLKTDTTTAGLIVTWLSFPAGFLLYWLIVYFPLYVKSLFSSATKAIIMEALNLPTEGSQGTGFSAAYVADYVAHKFWEPLPGFIKFLIIFPIILLFIAWLGLNLYLTKKHFRYALAITDSRVIGFSGSQEMDVRYDQLVNCFVEQSLWGKLFGYGTVTIQTKKLSLEFHNRKNPQAVKKQIMHILDGES